MTDDQYSDRNPSGSYGRSEKIGIGDFDTFFAKPTLVGADSGVSLDASAATGPPWPRLVATGGYVAPRLIRWPTIVGAVLLTLDLLINGLNIVAIGRAPGGAADSSWVSRYGAAMVQMNKDFVAINRDVPSNGGSRSQFLSDWQTLHSDIVADSALPIPPGAAAAPWSIMLSDFGAGSSDVLQAAATSDQALALQAQQLINAGAAAAKRLDAALGLR